MSDSVQPHRRQPSRLLHPWDSPGKNTGVGWHCPLQFNSVIAKYYILGNLKRIVNLFFPMMLFKKKFWTICWLMIFKLLPYAYLNCFYMLSLNYWFHTLTFYKHDFLKFFLTIFNTSVFVTTRATVCIIQDIFLTAPFLSNFFKTF